MRRAALPLLALALATACGSGARAPVTVPSDELPFDLARRVEPSGTEAATTVREVAFVRRDRLTVVNRRIPSDQPALPAVLRALLEGPTQRETDRGIQTMIPPTARLLEVRFDGGLATVDLSGEFQQAAPSDTIVLRVAQVVWTITSIAGVTDVAFAIDGESVSAVDGAGQPVDRPVTRSDFQNLAP